MSKHHKVFAATIMIAAAVLGGAATASAEPKVDPVGGPGKGCPIVHEDDNGNVVKVEYASPGTRNGALVCGNDGEWSFGRTVGNSGAIRGSITDNGLATSGY
ncbi:hypothetical protein MWU77_01665 [Rhodococcus sp. F64268]|uniref:hypothetical protein n=1 Tax=unclassified Rhodococcus (in: high G+C Gram-positive bacteria) TaxID=192944 RepID=UPI001F0F415D|nr:MULTISPECIES: hypothetical protein [unclassified Rhodococcus (in: high G+C Gram-positive bacteria)]MCK0089483.1 hypothetical protein [Rhodococcus sp. F64268]